MSRAAAARGRATLGAQIGFTVLALILAVGAYVLAGYGKRGQLPATFGAYAATFVRPTGTPLRNAASGLLPIA